MQNKKITLLKKVSLGALLFAPFWAYGQTSNDTSSIKDQSLSEVVVLGTRGAARTFTQSPVPVDVIEMKKLSADAPQVSVNGLLNYTVPSFTSTTQTVADGTDHIDPASLRGLGPDQTLVLINGKRRHSTALVNVNGTMGRGSVGTDLNAIPSMAIERLEVLRDGASAQYGSDAIAGVINLGLRKNSSGTQVRVTAGGNASTYQAYTEIGKGNYSQDRAPQYVSRNVADGGTIQVGINHGISIGKQKQGYLNLTGSFDARDYTNRSGEETGAINNTGRTGLPADTSYFRLARTSRETYRMRVGQSTLVGGQVFANFGYTLDQKSETEVYAFGGASYRYGTSAGFYRHPFNNRNILGVFRDGYLPIITSKILDLSLAAGVRGKIAGKWNYDISSAIGSNSFNFGAENLVNASSKNPKNYKNGAVDGLDSNKTKFDAGGVAFLQSTSNIDVSRGFDVLEGLNIAGGLEFRYEQYQQIAGETASWANYNARNANNPSDTAAVDVYGTVFTTSFLENNITGVPPAGSNVFPGFRPNVAFKQSRSSFAAYLDVEQNFAKWLVLNVAGRFENYSDFGSNFSGKIATRINPLKWLAIRGSVSSGFRAPSLHQRYIAKTSSVIVGSVPTEQGTFNNSSAIAQLVGIPSLRPEVSFSYSAGFTVNIKKFKFALDAYTTDITDRIIYTDPFTDTLKSALRTLIATEGASTAAFFVNAIDTRNRGIDAVVSYSSKLPNQQSIRVDLSGTISQVELVGDVKSSSVLQNYKHYYLSPVNRALMTEAFPRAKFNLIVNYSYKKWNLFVRGSYVGGVTHVESVSGRDSVFFRQKLSPLFVTDLSLSYNVTKKIKVTAGVNNLFDIYPDIISATKGSFFRLETNPNSTNYNTIKQDNISVKDLNSLGITGISITNDNGLTSNNQFVYSRRTSQIGLNGRFLFLRVEITL